MPNVHTTLTSLFTAIANAIRGKTGSSAQIVADDFPDAIDAIPTGTPLPSLTDPASASDILDGKEAIDGQGQVLTGTLVPPVDTGAGGLYKMIVQGETLPAVVEDEGITGINSANRTYVINTRGVRELRLPNCNSLGTYKIFYADSALSILELGADLNVTSSSSANVGMGFIDFLSVPEDLKVIGIYTLGSYSTVAMHNIRHQWYLNVKTLSEFSMYNVGGSYMHTITFDSLTSIGRGNFGNVANSTFTSLIIRAPTMCVATGSLIYRTSDISTGFTKIYVPKSLESSYKSATNWTAVASQIYGIDEDTTGTVGTQFTPAASVAVNHWDQVDLQSYSVGTVDTTNGSITPTHDGRLLIRGLDSSDNIVHVTYLQIGTGFDEEANLA